MSKNISQIKRDELISQINDIEEHIINSPQDENTKNLLRYVNNIRKEIKTKKFGLVFEEHREKIDDILEDNLPVLNEQKELNISNGDLVNFLIEGDNLAALKLLNKTHHGKIDVIYIDPPYNMGEKDFIYDDSYVNSDDAFRHSKWLSFISKRLVLAKKLLTDDGVIFISIDDHELAELKTLCDGIFGDSNFIANCFVLDNLKGKTNDNFVTSVGSRLLIYAKNKQISNNVGFAKIENIFAKKVEEKYTREDELGLFNPVTFKKTGQAKYREDRPYMYYPILEKDGLLYSITDEEYSELYDKDLDLFNDSYIEKLKNKYSEFNFILPLSSQNEYLRWTAGFNTFKKRINKDIYWDNGVKQKSRPEPGEILQIYSSGTPKTLLYKPSYSMGTQDLNSILPNSGFSFPKPLDLIKDILCLIPKNEYTVLDFFAGSGTTGQAIFELNNEDKGKRRFILCTNNQNEICRNITYKRLEECMRVNKNNCGLKYYRVDYIPINDKLYYEYADELLLHIKELVELENGIDFDNNNKIAIILSEDELDDFVSNLPGQCETIYLGHDVMLTAEQKRIFVKKHIDIRIIPNYYYSEVEG